MKKIVLLLLLCTANFYAFSQQTDSAKQLTNADYMRISRNHKTGAWIFTGIGAAVLTGTLAYDLANLFNTESTNTTAFYVVGLASVGTGIVLFRSAAKNKRLSKANLTTHFKINPLQSPIQPTGIPQTFPAVALQLHL